MSYPDGSGPIAAEAEAVIAITREAEAGKLVELDPRELYSAVVPRGTERQILDLREYLDVPDRATGTVITQTVDDFARYVGRHDDLDRTTVWVDMESGLIVGVLDDHGQAGPGWGEHRARLQLKPTEQWAHWTKLDGKLIDQEAFAEHIEEGLKEIVEPSGPTMLEVVQSMQGHTKADWKQAVRLTDGSISFVYHEDATATAGGNGDLQIPERFVLGISPFLGEAEYKVDARLRYRVSGGELRIGYKLDRPGDVVRDATDHIADRRAAVPRARVHRPPPMSTMADDAEAIHTWFSLTYANYLTIPRSVLQSMPDAWQRRFVTCLQEMEASFGHLDWPAYHVQALVRGPELRTPTCPTCDGEGKLFEGDEGALEKPCDGCDGSGLEDEVRYETAEEVGFRTDPIPHYNRGRTRLEPRR